MINILSTQKEFIGIVIAFLGVIIPLVMFLINKNREQKQINFERFHEKMIRKISNIGGSAGLDEQIAVIYDLKRFPGYYLVIKRILTDLIKWWKPQLQKNPHFIRLINEANLTLAFINKNLLSRYYSKFKERLSN